MWDLGQYRKLAYHIRNRPLFHVVFRLCKCLETAAVALFELYDLGRTKAKA